MPGRRLDDKVSLLLRYQGGSKGMLWASQFAPGHESGLRLRVAFPLAAQIQLPTEGPIGLAWQVDHAQLRWPHCVAKGWINVGPMLDASPIPDEAGRGIHGSFTGAFVGMLAFDLSGGTMPADFTYFNYTPLGAPST